jgi:hypothetical protein
MRTLAWILLCVAPAAGIAASEEGMWASVPAGGDGLSLSVLSIPDAPSADDIRIIGPTSQENAPGPAVPRSVFAVRIPDSSNESAGAEPEADAQAVPANARWPDSHGRILSSPANGFAPTRDAGIRNPWDVRMRPKGATEETVFACGGIIDGGESGPVAFLNGRICRRGDAVGDFSVARVLPDKVLLERNGIVFVIPRGRRTTVATGNF